MKNPEVIDLFLERGKLNEETYPEQFQVKELHKSNYSILYEVTYPERFKNFILKVSIDNSREVFLRYEIFLHLVLPPFNINPVYIVKFNDSQQKLGILMSKGKSFNEWMNSSKLNKDEAIYFFYTILVRLSRLHWLGLVFRDIAPENMLVINGACLPIDFQSVDFINNINNKRCGYSKSLSFDGDDKTIVEAANDLYTGLRVAGIRKEYISPEEDAGRYFLNTDLFKLAYIIKKTFGDSSKDMISFANKCLGKEFKNAVEAINDFMKIAQCVVNTYLPGESNVGYAEDELILEDVCIRKNLLDEDGKGTDCYKRLNNALWEYFRGLLNNIYRYFEILCRKDKEEALKNLDTFFTNLISEDLDSWLKEGGIDVRKRYSSIINSVWYNMWMWVIDILKKEMEFLPERRRVIIHNLNRHFIFEVLYNFYIKNRDEKEILINEHINSPRKMFYLHVQNFTDMHFGIVKNLLQQGVESHS